VISLPEIRWPRAFGIAAALALGLWVDVHTELPGQLAVGAATWALLLALLARLHARARWLFLACVSIATAGELFLSLGWGLYTYRLGNVPMFVPPGHALMLMLGIALAARLPEAAAGVILGAAGAYALAAAAAGFDTLGVPLALVLAVAVLALPSHRRLFASTFVLCLALELYGTTLGNWSWHGDVPWVGLVTTNPPGVAGAFYAALDALVLVALASRVAPQRRSPVLARA
jgi:hypothetical protein